MRKVIATGETIMDIVFQNNQPTAAIPGGSAFNSIISIGRTGIPAVFIGETGDDRVGQQIISFLQSNQVNADFMATRAGVKSAISLAYLDENNDANYTFYKNNPLPNSEYSFPEVKEGDVILFGSYYAICSDVRAQVKRFLEYARNQGAILFYDLNFRKPHKHQLPLLWDAIHENFKLSHIVRGSADDFEVMYSERDAATVYRKHISAHCPLFICTGGGKGISLCTPEIQKVYSVKPIETVSTIGAGDNFNAGFVYGLIRNNIQKENLLSLKETEWNELISYGQQFAANVCSSIYNCIDIDFGNKMRF